MTRDHRAKERQLNRVDLTNHLLEAPGSSIDGYLERQLQVSDLYEVHGLTGDAAMATQQVPGMQV